MKNERFGNLVRGMVNGVAAFEGKRAEIIEGEIGEEIGVAQTTIQGYKQGRVPESHRAIEALAGFGVRRGYLNRVWVQRLLASIQYHDISGLVERLCPTTDTPVRPPRARDNLPAPPYSSYIMRADAYAQVVEGLNQRSGLVVILSMGGMGKTSLALEVAKRSIGQGFDPVVEGASTRFDAAVWVSDKDQPGTTSLSSVLDAVAMTLNYPGLTRLDPREKQYEVGQLLRQQRILVVIDNFETISDPALLDWLLRRLPEPSKAIVTTRIYRREFQRGAWMVELDGMYIHEAEQLIAQHGRRLRLSTITPDLAQQLWTVTGGNPKAIEMALGYTGYTRQSLGRAINQLTEQQGELFDELFKRSWALLDATARMLLTAAALFPTSVRSETLMSVVGADDLAFELALQKVCDLGLLDVTQVGHTGMQSEPRYAMHPLTRAFVETRNQEHCEWLGQARERWLAWAITFARRFGGYTIDDVSRLGTLDAEEPTLFAAAMWAVESGRYQEAIELILAVEFYYYVRALWGKKLALHQLYLNAAHRLGDSSQELHALALHIQLLSHQERLDEVLEYLPRLQELAETFPLTASERFSYYHTLGLYRLAKGEIVMARTRWERLLDRPDELTSHQEIGARHWLARCLYLEGERGGARTQFELALAAAQSHGFRRLIGRNQLGLALIDIDEDNLVAAEQRLTESQEMTQQDDWEQVARLSWALARLAAGKGDAVEAQARYEHAQGLFERMGLGRESAKARAELAVLRMPN